MVLSSAIVCDHDRRIADDRRSSFHMIADDRRPYCDLRSAICDPRSYGNQPLDRTWFYLLRSSAITIAGSQTIADLIAICDHMETSLKYQRFLYNKSIVCGFYNQVVLLVYVVFASFYAHCSVLAQN